MSIRYVWLVVVILLVPSVASADQHRAGLYGGVSAARGSTLWGAHFNFEYAVSDADKRREQPQHVYLMADYSIHESNRNTLMGGANFTGKLGGGVAVSLRALAGSVWGDGSSDFAGGIGAAVDVDLGERYPPSNPPDSVRFALRLQADEIIRGGDAKNFWRASVGVVVKFPKR